MGKPQFKSHLFHGLCFFRTQRKSLRENNCLLKGCRCIVTKDITALSWGSSFAKEKIRAKVCEGRVYTFFLEFIVFIKERQSFVECESWRFWEHLFYMLIQMLAVMVYLCISISSAFIEQLDIIHRTEKHSWVEPELFLDMAQGCFEKAEVLLSSSQMKCSGGSLYIYIYIYSYMYIMGTQLRASICRCEH